MVLGHNHPAIRNAVIEAAERGLSFGAPTEMEVKMAALVTELLDGILESLGKAGVDTDGAEVALLVNGLGATPPMELSVVMRRVDKRLAEQLRERGYNPITVDLSELLLGGGGIKCCTLELRGTR